MKTRRNLFYLALAIFLIVMGWTLFGLKACAEGKKQAPTDQAPTIELQRREPGRVVMTCQEHIAPVSYCLTSNTTVTKS
jgi:hypothetical protein